MRNAKRAWSIVAAVWLMAMSALAGQAITKEDLVKMAKAGLDEALIIQMVQGAESVPVLTTDDIIALKAEGVSQKVLQEVILQAKRLERVGPHPGPALKEPAAAAVEMKAITPAVDPNEARIKEWEAQPDTLPIGKALALLLGKTDEVNYGQLLKPSDADKALLDKAFAFCGKVEEFSVGESSGRLINFNKTNWVDAVPAIVLVRRNGLVHILTEDPVKKPADGVDPVRLSPADNQIEESSKTEVQFFLSITKYDSITKRDVSYRAKIKCSAKDLGKLLLDLGWKKKK